MLRLNLTNEPAWHDLGGGLRLLLRPTDLDLIAEAEEDDAVVAARADFAADETPDAAKTAALGRDFAAAVARLAIIGWQGVGDAEGREITEPYAEAIDALMRHPAVFAWFQTRYLQPALVLVSEGNVSAPAPNGTMAGARTTAGPAKPAAKPARKRITDPKR